MFGGQAPIAMAQMGQGWPQVGASIANSTLAGYEGIAKGIGAGIASVADAYAKHKEMQQTNKAYENLIKNPVAQKALGLNADTAQQFLMQADNLGTKAKHNLFSTFIPMTLQQNQTSDQITASNWRTIYGEQQAGERAKMQIEGNPLNITAPAQALLDYEKAAELKRLRENAPATLEAFKSGMADLRNLWNK